MLGAYDRAKETNRSKPVQVSHGVAGETAVRNWLAEFLPKRYGVAEGYIVSWRLSEEDELRHYDVIVYDALESPTLWIEEERGGKAVRAIPAEHVLAVFEVKSKLTRRNARAAMQKLRELEPFLAAVDLPGTRYPAFCPNTFFSALLFFEIEPTDADHRDILTTLLPDNNMRGFLGGLVLRSSREPPDHCGRFEYIGWDVPDGEKKKLKNGDVVLMDTCPPLDKALSLSHGRRIGESLIATKLGWGREAFAQFAFDIVANLAGRYEPGTLSSWHGYTLSPTAALRHQREASRAKG